MSASLLLMYSLCDPFPVSLIIESLRGGTKPPLFLEPLVVVGLPPLFAESLVVVVVGLVVVGCISTGRASNLMPGLSPMLTTDVSPLTRGDDPR